MITEEMMKAMGELGLEKLKTSINNICLSKTAPKGWKRDIVVRIPMKGNPSESSI